MTTSLQYRCVVASSCGKQYFKSASRTRRFSSTPQPARRMTKARREAYEWVSVHAPSFEKPIPGSTNYLSDHIFYGRTSHLDMNRAVVRENKEYELGLKPGEQIRPEEAARTEVSMNGPRPFPSNPYYVSQTILDDEYKERIWTKVMIEGMSVRDTSVELGVDMRRVGAIVRMKEIEKEWLRKGKELAYPYHDAIMSMVPTFNPRESKYFEHINDLPVHSATETQIFYPTSESKQFTRADAAKVFQDDLLPADDRIPHPQMIEIARDMKARLSKNEMEKKARLRDEATEKRKSMLASMEREKEKRIKKVEGRRATFRIQPVKVDDAGRDGRGLQGVGWRYGNPFKDRSKGQNKIPTRAGV